MIEVVLTGTGSPIPDPNRAGPSTLVRAGTRTLLVDAGRGALMRVAAAGSGADRLDAVLLTHLHSDHITDLNDVITTRWVTTFEPSPLHVIGPPGTQQVVDALLDALRLDIGYRTSHHADLDGPPPVVVDEVGDGVVLKGDEVVVRVAPTDHRPVQPTIGFRVEHGGRAVVVAGDTVPCDSLDALCSGADAVVITAIRRDILATVPVQRLQDVCDYHSSVEDAARTASKAGASTLVLTHLVPAPAPGAEQDWVDLARPHFGGDVVVGHDLLRLTV